MAASNISFHLLTSERKMFSVYSSIRQQKNGMPKAKTFSSKEKTEQPIYQKRIEKHLKHNVRIEYCNEKKLFTSM